MFYFLENWVINIYFFLRKWKPYQQEKKWKSKHNFFLKKKISYHMLSEMWLCYYNKNHWVCECEVKMVFIEKLGAKREELFWYLSPLSRSCSLCTTHALSQGGEYGLQKIRCCNKERSFSITFYGPNDRISKKRILLFPW